MDYNSLIHEFMEGNLDKSQEYQLFSELINSDELRGELKNSIAMDKAFNKKLSSYVPSAKSTIDVFSKLGFAAPAYVSNAGKTNSVPKPTASKSFMNTVYGSLATGITAVIAYFLLLSPAGDAALSNAQQGLNRANFALTLTGKQISEESSIPYIISDADNNETRNKTEQPKTMIKYVYMDKSDRIINQEQQVNVNAPLFNIPVLDKKELEEHIDISNLNYHQNSPVSSMNTGNRQIEYPFSNVSAPVGLTLELSNAQYITNPEANAFQTTVPKFQNINFSLLYDLSDNLAIGADLRHEKFYQKYTGRNQQGELYEYTQYPTFTSISGLVRYRFYNSEDFNFFNQLMVGGLQTKGFTMRDMIGFEWKLTNYAGIILGAEYNHMFFEHQGNWFNSSKLGFHYGLSYCF